MKDNRLLILVPLVLFSVLYIPFIGSIPYLDGNIDLIRSYDFFNGGFANYFAHWNSVHPPLKLFITDLLFSFLGINAFSYNIIGYIFGLLGVFYIYKLCLKLFDTKTAALASILLATNPLFLATGLFSLTDFLVSVLIVVALYFFLKKNYILYCVIAALAVLTKETALLLPISILFVNTLSLVRGKVHKFGLILSNTVFMLLPLLVYFLWNVYIKANGQSAWNDWNFSQTASKGTIFTIYNNLTTLKILNDYAYQNWAQLFFLNFNWVFWVITFLGVISFVFKNPNFIKELFHFRDQRKSVIFVIVLISFLYFVSVLSFQTYTIPRYALPILCLLLIGFSRAIFELVSKLNFKLKLLSVFLLLTLIILRLFFSADPASLWLWGKIKIFDNQLYAVNEHLAGNDGITYNMQYNLIVKLRSEKILNAKGTVFSNQCNWIFPDPNNDFKTIKILNLNININHPCDTNYAP